MYLKRKIFNLLPEKRIETERILAMGGSRQVLVQVVLFQFWGCGHPPLNEVLSVSEFISENDQKKQNILVNR